MNYFLTGATGFIGRHLTKALAEQGEQITILLNRRTIPEDLEQYIDKINTVKVDILNCDQLAKEMSGHDVVVHLAYGSSGTTEQQYNITVEGTRSALKAANEAKVKRLVHISTISVYGEPPKSIVYTEDTPRYASLGLYTNLKQEAEAAVLNFPSSITECVVLQPGIVYGPDGSYWTEGLMNILMEKYFPLVNRGQGFCNLIHVSDVVKAIILAAKVSGIDKECFIITQDRPVKWCTLLKAYERIIGHKCLINIPTQMMKQYNVLKRMSGKVQEYRFYSKVMNYFFKVFKVPNIRKQIQFLDSDIIDLFAAKPHFSNQKAKDILGFEPIIDFEEGIISVKDYFERSRMITPNL